MASGGLLGANTASEGNYTGQMEYLSGTLGLISAVIGSVASAAGSLGSLGDLGEGLGKEIANMLKGNDNKNTFFKGNWHIPTNKNAQTGEFYEDWKPFSWSSDIGLPGLIKNGKWRWN